MGSRPILMLFHHHRATQLMYVFTNGVHVMSDVNDTMSSKNAELASDILVITNLAEIGEKVSLSENKTNPDVLNTLFQVIKEKLDALLVSVEKGV